MRDLIVLLRQLAQLLGRERRWRWVLLVGMALFITLVEMVGAAAVFALLALIGTSGSSASSLPAELGPLGAVLPDGDTSALQVGVALGLIAFFILRSVLLVARSYAEGRILTGASVALADRFLAGYVAMPYLFHTRRSSADLIRNSFQSTQALNGGVLRPLALLLAELVLVTGLTVLLFVTDPLAAGLAALVLGSAVIVIQRVLRPRMRIWGRSAQEATTGSLASIQQALGGIRDLKLLGRQEQFLRAHGRHRRRLARSQYLSTAAAALPRALIELSLITTIVVVFLVSVLAGPDVAVDVSTLGLFAYAGIRLQPALQGLVGAVNTLRYAGPLVDDLLTDDALMRATVVSRAAVAGAGNGVAAAAAPMREGLALRGVTFDYAAEGAARSDRPALVAVDLQVRRGEFVGICGPTGGGKSTLLDLLVGLLPPTAGEVLVDGRPLGDEPHWWWSQLGVVSQAVFLTDDTLRHNVAFGRSGEEVDEERLLRCIARAQLTEVVAELPDGLDTIVGERGIRLSGGQRQRVAIARALYREPDVLVLDEGTSALDGATEAAIVAALDQSGPDRTLIAVAHRLDTIRRADRIIVVDGGRIVGDGGWDELLATQPVFRSLVGTGGSTGGDAPAGR